MATSDAAPLTAVSAARKPDTANKVVAEGCATSSMKAGTVRTAAAARGQNIVGLRPKRSHIQPPSNEKTSVLKPPTTVAPIASTGDIFSVVMA